ncbi:MAG: PorT family protein [Bacteroidetes bacterium]|nr:MAG: PorT family protein [Bacteroidota bacterium]REK00627.1 MAG: PorT family protein [Bacteroidota bacterium]REK35251.1 MAG: PorT family protein [Bacteroidota bacterium]REK48328.1 MAG: PorT family protein [Bacteroidota bacterium]
MRKILYLIFCVLFLVNINVSGQEKKTATKLYSPNDNFILFFNWDNWNDMPSNVETAGFRSRGFAFLFMNDKQNSKGKLGFAYGFGMSSHNVHSNAFPGPDSTGNKTELMVIPDSVKYDLNKLSLNYIDAAIEFRFHSPIGSKGKKFKISLGFKGGLLVQSHTKFKNKDDKIKTYDIDNLSSIQYGPTFRIGYSRVGISGYYGLSNVFKDNKGPDMTPYSVGIALTF